MPLAMPAEVITRSSSDVENIAYERRPRVAPGDLVGQLMVGREPSAVEEPGLAERVGAGADTRDGAAGRVVGSQAARASPVRTAGAYGSTGERHPGTRTRSSGASSGQARSRADRNALRAHHLVVLGHVREA